MVEALAGSGDWRAAVAHTAYEARTRMHDAENCVCPYLDAVQVDIVLYFAAPKKRTSEFPHTRTTGDIDKHARNILDALQDAAVVKDDAQVTFLAVRKRYANATPGASITVRTVAA